MIHHKISNEEIRNAMRIVGLDPDSKKHVGKYSLGMRQRLGIAQAIMEDPDILLLDEPLNGLDNEGVEEMEAVNVSDNEIVEERLDKIKNIFTALRKDKEAYISLSDVTDSGAELDERIKTEEANHKVTAEYKKRADEEFEKQLKSYPIPFCAAY